MNKDLTEYQQKILEVRNKIAKSITSEDIEYYKASSIFIEKEKINKEMVVDFKLNEKRQAFYSIYAYAIPNNEALETIARYQPIIELGAGSGYWAYELRKKEVDILAFDDFSWDYKKDNLWTQVEKGSVEKLEEYPNRTLMICWPPFKGSFAYDCLRAYQGNVFIYIGEDKEGCTGTKRFHNLLNKQWILESVIDIPRFSCMNDRLYVYIKK